MTGVAAVSASADAIARGRRVLRLEREALAEAEERLGEAFARAVALVADSPGRVIVAGVGKSGLIGRKIAATLTSTGTPATFLSPMDALHGDLGIVDADDVALLLSKSGESDELLSLLEHLKRLGVRTVAFTGNVRSTLGRNADVALDCWVREEACPHDLAPTTSTTVALAIGDALAVALLEAKGFQREDFARIHPGGAIGRRLLTTVGDVMITDDLPLLAPDATMRDAVVQLAARRGVALVVDGERLGGVVTTGDLTRLIERGADLMSVRVAEVMTRTPRTARADELASAAVYRMEQHKVIAMPVVDDGGRVLGVVHLHDLMRAGAA
jgi:arabinose-5-phosphate isomerase